MKSLTLVIVAIALVSTISGCATVCNPQSPGILISSGNPVGIAAGAAQFTACMGYYATVAMINKKATKPAPAKISVETPITDAVIVSNITTSADPAVVATVNIESTTGPATK